MWMARKKAKIIIDTANTKIEEDEIARSFASFLRPTDLQDGDYLTIMSPAYLSKTKYGSRRHVEVKRADGLEGLLGLNKISLGNLVKAYGNNSEAWVGKKIVVRKQTILGKEALIVDKA
jgi:hypothetical protein